MNKYGKEMHGLLGKCTMIRFTKENFLSEFHQELENRIYSIDEIESLIKTLTTTVPIEIADDVLGRCEVVCELGIEIHEA